MGRSRSGTFGCSEFLSSECWRIVLFILHGHIAWHRKSFRWPSIARVQCEPSSTWMAFMDITYSKRPSYRGWCYSALYSPLESGQSVFWLPYLDNVLTIPRRCSYSPIMKTWLELEAHTDPTTLWLRRLTHGGPRSQIEVPTEGLRLRLRDIVIIISAQTIIWTHSRSLPELIYFCVPTSRIEPINCP